MDARQVVSTFVTSLILTFNTLFIVVFYEILLRRERKWTTQYKKFLEEQQQLNKELWVLLRDLDFEYNKRFRN